MKKLLFILFLLLLAWPDRMVSAKLFQENMTTQKEFTVKPPKPTIIKKPAVMPASVVYAASPVIVEAPTPIPTQAPVVAMSDNFYKSYIYGHESGNDPTRWNTSGCVGLGQACPASKLLAVCPGMDYGCEDSWFSAYAISVYGSWENAYYHWLANNNW